MTNEERIAANAAKGYIQIYESDGWAIYKKLNEVGGWTYYSDRIGNEGAYIIWDSTVRSEEELRVILEDLGKPEQIPFQHSWTTQPGLDELGKPTNPEPPEWI